MHPSSHMHMHGHVFVCVAQAYVTDYNSISSSNGNTAFRGNMIPRERERWDKQRMRKRMEDEGSLNHEKEWDEWKKRLKD